MGKPVKAVAGGIASAVGDVFDVAIGLVGELVGALLPPMDMGVDTGNQELRVASNPTRYAVFGETVTSGPIVKYDKIKEGKKEYHLFFTPLADHPCESVELYQLDGKQTTAASGNGYRLIYRLGNQTTAPALAMSEMSNVDSSFVGFNITDVYHKYEINSDIFPNGVQDVKFKVRGRRIYDPRKDDTAGGSGTHRANDESTWEWTDNAALINFHWKRFGGDIELPIESFDMSNIAAEANICDEMVTFTDKNGQNQTEKRYTCNGVVNLKTGQRSVESQLLSSCLGRWVRVGTKYYLAVGAYRGPSTLTITEADLKSAPKRQPSSPLEDRCNAVTGNIINPKLYYQESPYSPVVSTFYQTNRDGGRYLEHPVDFSFTQSETMAQRLARSYLEFQAAGDSITVSLGWKGLLANPLRVINLDLPTYGITGKEYEVIRREYQHNTKTWTIELKETAPEIWDDTIVPAEKDLTPNTPIDNTIVSAPTGLSFTPTPSDSYRQGVLTWDHEISQAIRRYTVLLTKVPDDGWYKAYYPVQASQDINNLPAGNYQAVISAENRFGKSSPGSPLTFNVNLPSTPATELTVSVLPGRVVITGPALPNESATYEWRVGFVNDFAQTIPYGRNITITVTPTQQDGTLYGWYRLVDGDLTDASWVAFTIENLIGLSSSEVTPELIANITFPTFPKNMFDTLTGLSTAIAQASSAASDNADVFESLLGGMAERVVTESTFIERQLGLAAEVSESEGKFEILQTSVEQKVDQIQLEAVRVNLQGKIDNLIYGDNSAIINAALGEIEGRVDAVELLVTPEALTTTVQSVVAEEDLATITEVETRISALGISDYVKTATFTPFQTKVDAAESTLESSAFKRSLVSLSMASDADESLKERLLAAQSQIFLNDSEKLDLEGAFAFQSYKVDVLTGEFNAQVNTVQQQFTQYDGNFASAFNQIKTVSEENQATAQELTEYKVAATAQINEAKSEAIATAQEAITASVGYCTIDDVISGHVDKSSCEAAGGTWSQLPLAQAFNKVELQFTDANGNEVTGSAVTLIESIVNQQNQLMLRAFFGVDDNGVPTGLWVVDEAGNATQGTIKLMANVTEFLRQNGTPFVTFDSAGNVATFNGQIKLSDGTVIGSIEQIRANDGEDGSTIYTEYHYSVDGSTAWHWPMADGDVYQRERVVTNGVPGNWSSAARIRGQDGADGANGADGVNGNDGTSIVWKGSFSSHPSNPQNGWAYRNTSDGISYVRQDNAWYQMTIDGQDGTDGLNGADGADGLSIVWKGESATPPTNPNINWAYRDTDNGRIYIYNGAAWELMVADGNDGVDGADGADGLRLFVTYHDNPVSNEPSTPTGNGTSGGWTTTSASTRNWVSQKVAADASSGVWGAPILIAGRDGVDGADGANGADGQDGADGQHGASFHVLTLRNGVFPSNATANSDFNSAYGRNPVLDDILSYVNSDQTVVSMKRYNGSSWVSPGALFPGDVIVKGTLAGDRLVAGTEIVSPVVRGGRFEAGAIQYNSGRMLTEYDKLAPFITRGFAQSRSNDRVDRTVTANKIVGPNYTDTTDTADGFNQFRAVFHKTDVWIRLDITKSSSTSAEYNVELQFRYQMTDTNHSAHNSWETKKTINVNPLHDHGSLPLMYIYTSREDSWDSLEIRAVCSANNGAGKPLSLLLQYTIYNNVKSSYTENTITNDTLASPSNPGTIVDKPWVPPGASEP